MFTAKSFSATCHDSWEIDHDVYNVYISYHNSLSYILYAVFYPNRFFCECSMILGRSTSPLMVTSLTHNRGRWTTAPTTLAPTSLSGREYVTLSLIAPQTHKHTHTHTQAGVVGETVDVKMTHCIKVCGYRGTLCVV